MAPRDSDDAAAYDERLAEVTVGPPTPLTGKVELSAYDPAWPERYRRESQRVLGALGARVIRLEHVGSTSVPGLLAKPIVDIVLEVRHSAAEEAYVPDLEAAGYVLRIREPEWFEHRMLRDLDAEVQIHVFSAECPETDRMVRFRDRLRTDPADRELYARTKLELASRNWKYVQQYADAKSEVIGAILGQSGR